MCNDLIIDKIIEKKVPLIFLDTCVFLDVLRVPYREEMEFSNLACVKAIMDKVESNEIILITNSLTKDEFYSNIENTFSDLKKQSKAIESQFDKLFKSIKFFTLEDITSTHTFNSQDTWLMTIKSFCIDFLNKAIILQIKDAERTRATFRVELNNPPSRKGGSVKDCIIFESLLSLCSTLRERNFNQSIFFVTSNTKDFGNINNCKVFSELDNLNIKFANQMHHVYSELGFTLDLT